MSGKIKQIALCILAVSVFTFTSCNPESDEGNDEVIDLRNVTEDGDSYRAARKNLTFSCEYYPEDTDWNYYLCNDVKKTGDDIPDWVKNSITVSDCDDGVKFTFTKPETTDSESTDYFIDWFNVDRLDGNGNTEVCRTSPLPVVTGKEDSDGNSKYTVNDTFDVIYPLVLPGRDFIMYVQYGYVDSSDGNANWSNYRTISLCYKIHTAHGRAMSRNLPKNFNSDKFVKIIDGRYLKLQNIIPPEGKNVKYSIWIRENKEASHENSQTIGGITDEVRGGVLDNSIFDLSEYMSAKNGYSFMYADVLYEYTLNYYPNQTFGTKNLKTTPVENSFFTNDEEE